MRAVCIAMLACACNTLYGIEDTELANDNPRTLLFDNSDSDVDLLEFPVPVLLDPTRVDYSLVLDPSVDLRFHDPDTDRDLPFEIEQWTPGGTSTVWVRVPQLDARSTTDRISMYMGDEARGHEDVAAMWPDYDLVVHAKNGTFTSSAAPSFTIKAMSAIATDGALASGIGFPTATSYVEYDAPTQLLDSWPRFTFEVSVYLDYASSLLSEEPRLVESETLHLGRLRPYQNVEGFLLVQTDVTFEGDVPTYLTAGVSLRHWTHIVYTYDGRTLWLYRDGVFADAWAFTVDVATNAVTLPLTFGHAINSFIGRLDEIRISREYRSAAWVYAQYLGRADKLITFPRAGELR